MRRLVASFLMVGLLTFGAAGCKKKRKREVAKVTQDDGVLATMVQTADPRSAVQLTKGFYAVENDAWRWTAHAFSVTLHPPKTGAQNGARLILKFAIPELSIQRLKSLKLSAKVNGLDLPVEEFTKSGDQTFTRDVPAAALNGDAVTVDFTLDKFLPPTPNDQRELGLIVSAVGFEAK